MVWIKFGQVCGEILVKTVDTRVFGSVWFAVMFIDSEGFSGLDRTLRLH